jgi:Zn-dependent M28 family amino/carboxypeptidase
VPAGLVIAQPSDLDFDRSDHYAFHLRGIPVLHFFTGLHPEYHTPADDVDLLNLDGLRTVGGLLMSLLWVLSTEPHPF